MEYTSVILIGTLQASTSVLLTQFLSSSRVPVTIGSSVLGKYHCEHHGFEFWDSSSLNYDRSSVEMGSVCLWLPSKMMNHSEQNLTSKVHLRIGD